MTSSPATPQIKHILVRHEQAAVHAADGYARATGKVGVALVTSGPGATNTVTGIATAYMDSIPIVVFTGQVPTALIGNDAFQEADIVGITRPCTKHNYLVKDINELARTINEAFYIARSGPARAGAGGPAQGRHRRPASMPKFPEEVKIKSYQPTYHANPRQMKRALEMIAGSAKKPVLYTGGGIISSNASEELPGSPSALQIPVTSTLMGLGGFPGTIPLWLGMLGMHGTYCRQHGGLPVRRPHRGGGPLRRPGHRQAGRSSPPTPRSSTSTSTPPPSARTSRWTSPSWATAGMP